jgi:hypothetical protein
VRGEHVLRRCAGAREEHLKLDKFVSVVTGLTDTETMLMGIGTTLSTFGADAGSTKTSCGLVEGVVPDEVHDMGDDDPSNANHLAASTPGWLGLGRRAIMDRDEEYTKFTRVGGGGCNLGKKGTEGV